jgi:hypothetical protein
MGIVSTSDRGCPICPGRLAVAVIKHRTNVAERLTNSFFIYDPVAP